MKKRIRVVGAAIVDGDKILVAQRPYSDKTYKSMKWEFPGGKVEAGESVQEAVRREVVEELGCPIEVDALLQEMEHEYPDFILRMTLCVCHPASSSMPKCLEHHAIRWCSADELPYLDWAAADARCYPRVVDYLSHRKE